MSWHKFTSISVNPDSSPCAIAAASAYRRAPSRSVLFFVAGLGATCSTIVFSTLAHAQEEQAALEEVIVTGSSIKRSANEGSLPVQVFEQQEIVRTGATSVTDFLQQLPAMQGFTSVSESVGGSGGGITTASLHDVGEQYTLVLLNGRRVAPSDSGTTIDLNSIPLAAIQRVEVLTDGASAIYGADAIAGVVNFILKQGESPLELSARMSRPQHPGGAQVNVAMSKGFGDLAADGYSAFFALSYDKLNSIKASQREFAKTGILSGRQGNLNYDFFNGSSRSVPPNVDVYGPSADAGVWGTDSDGNALDGFSFSPYYAATGSCPSSRVAHVLVGDQCYIDYTSTIEIAPEVERKGVYGTGKLALGASGWNAFADIAYTDVSTLSSIAPYPAEFSLSTSSSLYSTYIEPYLTPDQDAAVRAGGGVNVKYRLYDMGNRLDEYVTKALHFVTGLEGQAAGWDMTGAITVSNQSQHENYLGGWPLASSFNALMDSGTFDPFSEAPLSASEQAALKGTEYNGNYKKVMIRMLGFEANAQRKMFELPGGSFVASFGGEYRRNSYQETPSSVAANAEILFDDPQPAFDLSRDNMGVYTELLAPVLPTVELTAAARYDAVSGTDDEATDTSYGDTESATTFKIGAKWQPVRSFAVRSSYGTGFRVATMKEIGQPKVDFGVTGGSFDCPFSPSYDPLGYIAAGYVCPDSLQYEVFKSGNANLRPEKSTQWNLGVILKPVDRLTIELNYWSVNVRDAVDSVSESLILNNAAKYLDLYTTKYKSSNGRTYVAILDTPINIGRKENAGIDWDFSYAHPVSFGTITGRISGTHLTKSRYTVPGTDDQWTSSLNKYGVDDKVAFRDVIHASVGLAHSGFEHTLSSNWRNGYTDVTYTADDCVFTNDAGDCVEGALHVPSYMTVDWMTSWTFEHVTLGFSVRNLFDKSPPLSLRSAVSHQLGYDPRYTDAYLRTFVLNASIKY